jgi:nucleoid-associated protein YgaU
MGLAAYLLATTLAGLVARIIGLARWSAAVDAISPLLVRRLLQGAAGLTVAASVTTAQAAAWAAPGVPAGPVSSTPIMRRLPPDTPTTTGTAPPAPTPPAPAPPPPGTAAPAQAPAAQAQPPPATAAPAQAPTSQAQPATWVIRPGDNLWSVAEATLVRAWGRVPSDAEVDGYWTRLIAVNGVRLAHGDDPDLVFPGQVFELPAPPPVGQR